MAEPSDIDVRELVDTLWRHLPHSDNVRGSFSPSSARFRAAYEDYYRRQWLSFAGRDDGFHVALRTPQELNKFIRRISAAKCLTRKQVLMDLQSSCNGTQTDETLENTLNHALSLLLMVKFGPVVGETQPCRHMHWKDCCLTDYIRGHFGNDPILESCGIRLPRSFNAWSIQSIGGIKIHFTDNLADHLMLIEDAKGKNVLIFHHVSFLECCRSPIFPDGFWEETVDTLALIFPESEFGSFGRFKSPRSPWLHKLCTKGSERAIDSQLGSWGTLQAEERRIERFRFWRDRLVVLKQEYDDATPSSLSQWWHDRRNRVVWCSFWIAVLVLGLGAVVGVIQCVQGGLQVSKS